MRLEGRPLSLHPSKYEVTSAALMAPASLSVESQSLGQKEIAIQQNVEQYRSGLPSSGGRHLEGVWPTSQQVLL